ncbi:Hsp20/alpha crystallin family protein [Nocardiopsis baichengensis]|uniref:Hsp20/alpha crystallin family protein n=1 Tax=Nocardiopsis baichengensis TaxID=280240 RepID=UPI0003471BC1|nr:Hsp20/alpha crystallin family protein [Nocardiopsis baichengensis]
MLMRTDPFREFDRLTQRVFNDTRPAVMPMDAYREGDEFVIHFDMPGVATDSIDLQVERDVLTVKADRPAPERTEGRENVVSERPTGSFSRQLFLGKTLDTDRIKADYADGVLTVVIPVAEQAKPRKIAVGEGGTRAQIKA